MSRSVVPYVLMVGGSFAGLVSYFMSRLSGSLDRGDLGPARTNLAFVQALLIVLSVTMLVREMRKGRSGQSQ